MTSDFLEDDDLDDALVSVVGDSAALMISSIASLEASDSFIDISVSISGTSASNVFCVPGVSIVVTCHV